MARVKVTFYMEGNDPGHDMGLTEETYNRLTDQLMMSYGAEDIEIENLDFDGTTHSE